MPSPTPVGPGVIIGPTRDAQGQLLGPRGLSYDVHGLAPVTDCQEFVDALRLREAGLAAFPVNDKKPAVTGYLETTPIGSQRFRRMPWASCDGVGWSLHRGLVILDLDPDPGRTVEELLAAIEAQYGCLPALHQQRTTRGIHALFAWVPPPDAWISARLWLPENAPGKVDVIRPGHRFAKVRDIGWALGSALAPRLPEALETAGLPRVWLTPDL